VLCDIEGFSYEEIAATLGVKLGTVRSRIHRGRAQLRAALEHRRPAPVTVTGAGARAAGTKAHTTGTKGGGSYAWRRPGLVPRLKRSGGS
jgi:carbon monoxide dehydrogenase subunit G